MKFNCHFPKGSLEDNIRAVHDGVRQLGGVCAKGWKRHPRSTAQRMEKDWFHASSWKLPYDWVVNSLWKCVLRHNSGYKSAGQCTVVRLLVIGEIKMGDVMTRHLIIKMWTYRRNLRDEEGLWDVEIDECRSVFIHFG